MPKYSVLEAVLVEDTDFDNMNALTGQIEARMIKASDEILDYLKTLN